MTANFDEQEPKTATKAYERLPVDGNGIAHYNRAITRLKQSEWDKARADLASATEEGLDVAALFIETYGDAGDFEDAFEVELPPDIADIVDPISEEEDAALLREMEESPETEFVSEECVMAILRGEDGN